MNKNTDLEDKIIDLEDRISLLNDKFTILEFYLEKPVEYLRKVAFFGRGPMAAVALVIYDNINEIMKEIKGIVELRKN